MPIIQKNTMLKYLPQKFEIETLVNPARIYEFNNNDEKNGNVVYLIERELRIKDNFALQFAIQKAKEAGKELKIVHFKKHNETVNKEEFINRQIEQVKKDFKNNGLNLDIVEEKQTEILSYLDKLNTSILIIDFNPISDRNIFKSVSFKIYEIDGHNIVPARFVSDKQEYNAASMRRKIYFKIGDFITESADEYKSDNEAHRELQKFINERLPDYAEYKNNPTKNAVSGLSKYLNLGFISSQRAALEILKSDVSDENKEAFLEELIIRKELADNFCLYCKSFKTLKCAPNWAKETLHNHQNDIREYLYSKEELEQAKTYDKLWNASQIQLLNDGIIHGYMRMYWAKKILEWSETPQKALDTAIYLNDKYAFDATSADGYVGILWSIAGIHDRAFAERFVTGKIRPMTFNGAKSKFDVETYISKYDKRL